ncbi:hypothetical protein SOVF_104690 [Spinacia oleracea]|nr:hypothetical protein SOVF_104690 [Spinacia oleracea]
MSQQTPWKSYRMGVLVDPAGALFFLEDIDWDNSVVGKFYGSYNCPSQSLVQQIGDSQWLKRGNITVRRIGCFFIFLCSHSQDVVALLEQHTTVLHGRIIIFRKGGIGLVLGELDFDQGCLWIRVTRLPLGRLDPGWAVQCLQHVGFVEKLNFQGSDLPNEPEYRAKVYFDFSIPLIPGCFVPLGEGQAIWVYFRYEGVFKFCKKCGLMGHYTSKCRTSDYQAYTRITCRLERLGNAGFTTNFRPTHIPLYSNQIEGLLDKFRFRNIRINLLEMGLNVPELFMGDNNDDDDDV